ncbi:MAG TPA: twin-arginine translocase TatA/TatE family subunit [Myxococcales bacterium]|nr:twin-arginine translocase TatA/TatE family subunit [Myxococcales bacterium]HIK85013.1 twin-arginine translocase TatA/TatE family subunit [Myxococcales bacterium]
MFGIGPMELMAILVVALLVFGPKRIPELARTMGRGLAEFRRASNDLRQSLALDELERDLRQDPTRNQTIHRPENNLSDPSQDRPSQAGDDLDTPKRDPANEGAGELPLGEEHDHAHHDVDEAAVEVENAEPVSGEGSDAPHDAKENDEPADSELGNVPVSATKPADPQRG